MIKPLLFILTVGISALTINVRADSGSAANAPKACHDLLQFSAKKLGSSEYVDFCGAFAGKKLLVVNTASRCGFTPQFKELEKLHQLMGESLAIVGFPSNDFAQEYSDADKVAEVCYQNYGVTFTMLEESSVTGDNANALFEKLAGRTQQVPNWNFNKYLISVDGEQVVHLSSQVIGADLMQAVQQMK